MNKSDSPPILINGGVIPNEDCFSEIINDEKLCELAPIIAKVNSFYSRKIQGIYKDMPEFNEKLFDAIIPNLLDISTSKYGNYLIREILAFKEKTKVGRILSKLKGHIKELAKDEWGTFVIQELINNVDEEQLEEIFDEFIGNDDLDKIFNSENEKRVFLELFLRQVKNVNDKICEKILNSLVTLCNNNYFRMSIETLLINSCDNYYDLILLKCCNYIYEISIRKYGHFLISFFIQNKKGRNINLINKIYESFKGKVYNLSKEEFGTYAIQDAIEFGNPIQRNQIIDEIKNNKFEFVSLAKHKKGKFVIQKILIYLDRGTLGHLLYKLNEEIHEIKKSKNKDDNKNNNNNNKDYSKYFKDIISDIQAIFNNKSRYKNELNIK